MNEAVTIKTDSRPIMPLLGLSLGYFMVLLDTTVVSVALPAIGADLGGGLEGLQWVVNAYTIVFAGLLLSMGAICDKLGAKRVYLGGLAVFLAASALSAVVPTVGGLIALRAALGIGGAALMPASLTLLAHAYPGAAERAKALGIWAAVTGAAMAAGPVVGGLLVDAVGWRSIFLLNVPLAVISLISTLMFAGETNRVPRRSFDLAGQLTAITAIASLSFALMQGEADGWGSARIAAAFGLAAGSGILFVIVEAKGVAPLLPLRLFRNATVSGGLAAGMMINFALSGLLFVLPFFYQQARGLPAHAAGLSLLPMMIPLAFNPILTGRIVSRIGANIPMAAGFGLTAAGTLLLSRIETNSSAALMIAGLVLVGFGVSFTIPSMMTAVISSVPREQTGTVTGALNSSRQLGATLGVALTGLLLSRHGDFMPGMHESLLVMTVVLAAGSLISFLYMGSKKHAG